MQTLSTTIEAKDEYTRGHSYRVAEYAALIASELGWSPEEIQVLKHSALLHGLFISLRSLRFQRSRFFIACLCLQALLHL